MADYQVGSLGNLISGKSNGDVGAKIVYEEVAPRATKKAKQNKGADGSLRQLSKGLSAVKEKVAGTLLRKRKPEIADDEDSGAVGKSWKHLPSRDGVSEVDGAEPATDKVFSKNAARRIHIKKNTKRHVDDPDREARTVFVGNVPYLHATKEKLKKLFQPYGGVETVRIRSVPLKDPKMTKRFAAIKKEFHAERSSINAYVVFKTPEAAKASLEANGSVFHEHHLRVDMASNSTKPQFDSRKSVFVGNMPFSAEEEELWELFSSCGKIESTRIVRDPITAVSKGIAYVNFESADGAELALHLDGTEFKKRNISVRRYSPSAKSSQQKTPANKVIRHKGDDNPRIQNLKIKDKKKEEIKKFKKEKRAARLRENGVVPKKKKLDSSDDVSENSKPVKITDSEEASEKVSELTKPKHPKHIKFADSEESSEKVPEPSKSKHIRFADSEEISDKRNKRKFQGQTTEDAKKKKKRKINKGELKKKKFAKLLGASTQKKKKIKSSLV